VAKKIEQPAAKSWRRGEGAAAKRQRVQRWRGVRAAPHARTRWRRNRHSSRRKSSAKAATAGGGSIEGVRAWLRQRAYRSENVSGLGMQAAASRRLRAKPAKRRQKSVKVKSWWRYEYCDGNVAAKAFPSETKSAGRRYQQAKHRRIAPGKTGYYQLLAKRMYLSRSSKALLWLAWHATESSEKAAYKSADAESKNIELSNDMRLRCAKQ